MKKIFYLVFSVLILGCSGDDTPGTTPIPKEKENPVANNDNISAVENTALNFNSSLLLDNDSTIDNARIIDFDSETSAGGTVKDNNDGTYTYTPASNFTGEDSFSYTICVPLDDDRCSTATVTVTVADGGDPVAQDDTYTIDENETFKISNYLSNDQLFDNASTTEVNSDSGNATVVLEEDGTITYTPNESFSGTDTFTYTICDTDETPTCDTATVTINVTDEGSPVANDDELIISTSAGEVIISKLLNNDNLIDDAEIVSIDVSGANGTAVLNNDGTVSYTASSGFKGSDSFTYTLCDDDAEATCVTATVTIQVVDPVSFDIPDNLEDYYSDATFTQDPDLLYTALSDFTSTQHVNKLEYSDRHDYLYDADAALDDESMVVLMYSGELRPDDEYQLGDVNEGETYNTEHIYPQSKLNTEESKNDLHLLRVVDIDVNSERLNYPFTDGSGDYKLVNGDKWFPGDDWRGDVARIIMYVNLSYGDNFTDVGTLELFLKWNREDPVSAFEIQRNNVIEGAQGNRNPFIDNPFLATLIWGGEAAENRWD